MSRLTGELRRLDPARAWVIGLGLSLLSVLAAFAPLGLGSYFLPIWFAVLVIFVAAVRPRAAAASGVLLGVSTLFAWGVIQGLEGCARFNRSPNGRCEADPSAQLSVTALVFLCAVVATALAMWQARVRD